jgi:hypothetical protein
MHEIYSSKYSDVTPCNVVNTNILEEPAAFIFRVEE